MSTLLATCTLALVRKDLHSPGFGKTSEISTLGSFVAIGHIVGYVSMLYAHGLVGGKLECTGTRCGSPHQSVLANHPRIE